MSAFSIIVCVAEDTNVNLPYIQGTVYWTTGKVWENVPIVDVQSSENGEPGIGIIKDNKIKYYTGVAQVTLSKEYKTKENKLISKLKFHNIPLDYPYPPNFFPSFTPLDTPLPILTPTPAEKELPKDPLNSNGKQYQIVSVRGEPWADFLLNPRIIPENETSLIEVQWQLHSQFNLSLSARKKYIDSENYYPNRATFENIGDLAIGLNTPVTLEYLIEFLGPYDGKDTANPYAYYHWGEDFTVKINQLLGQAESFMLSAALLKKLTASEGPHFDLYEIAKAKASTYKLVGESKYKIKNIGAWFGSNLVNLIVLSLILVLYVCIGSFVMRVACNYCLHEGPDTGRAVLVFIVSRIAGGVGGLVVFVIIWVILWYFHPDNKGVMVYHGLVDTSYKLQGAAIITLIISSIFSFISNAAIYGFLLLPEKTVSIGAASLVLLMEIFIYGLVFLALSILFCFIYGLWLFAIG